MGSIRHNAAIEEALGDSVRFEPVWWLNGDPWINGGVRLFTSLMLPSSFDRSR